MMFNELEIISWCYTMYLLLTYDEIKYHLEKDGKSHSEVKYCNRDELVLAAARAQHVADVSCVDSSSSWMLFIDMVRTSDACL